MFPFIRRATSRDIPGMVDILLFDAERRRALDPALWPLTADASARIATALDRGLAGANPSARELWLLAETSGQLVGITHAMIVPAPPIYGVAVSPGLFLDDCFTTPEAPSGTAEALLAATEGALRDAGARGLIASHPAAGPWRPLYESHGYEPVTLYMAKHGFSVHDLPPDLRRARPEDVQDIVKLSADHRSTHHIKPHRRHPRSSARRRRLRGAHRRTPAAARGCRWTALVRRAALHPRRSHAAHAHPR